MPETIHLTLRRVRHHDSATGFTVAVGARDGSGEEVTFVGYLSQFELGELVAVTGDWQRHKKWGLQFAAESVAPVVPTSAEGIESYLAAGHVKGIGATLARRIVDRFGAEALRVIDEQPERLREIPGVGRKTVAKLRALITKRIEPWPNIKCGWSPRAPRTSSTCATFFFSIGLDSWRWRNRRSWCAWQASIVGRRSVPANGSWMN